MLWSFFIKKFGVLELYEKGKTTISLPYTFHYSTVGPFVRVNVRLSFLRILDFAFIDVVKKNTEFFCDLATLEIESHCYFIITYLNFRSFCQLGKSYPAIISLASPKQ